MSTETTLAKDDRIQSEIDFHNKRFTAEVREPVHIFYQVVRPAFRRYETRLAKLAPGKDVLEYGCAVGNNSLRLSSSVKSIFGIDISDVAVDKATKSAAEQGLTNTKFAAMNAEAMTFADDSFDLVFGSSILHHLDLNRSYSEISRVLRPGGIALFLEPLGHNPIINAYRDRTPEFRTPDEHPLLKTDFKMASNHFRDVNVRLYGLASLGAIPFLKVSQLRNNLGELAIFTGTVIDQAILKLPMVRWLAWFSVLELKK